MPIWVVCKARQHCGLCAVLGVSLLLEGFSLLVAVRTVTAGAASHGISFAEFVKRGMDPTSIAVMMEDGAACAGLVIAGLTLTAMLPNDVLYATLAYKHDVCGSVDCLGIEHQLLTVHCLKLVDICVLTLVILELVM